MMKLTVVLCHDMRRLIAFISIYLICIGVAIAAPRSAKALEELDKCIDMRYVYISERQHRIDSLMVVLHSLGDRAHILMEIADAYTAFDNDSAITYLYKGVDHSTPDEAVVFRWKLASLLPLGGFFETAQNQLDAVPVELLPDYYLSYYYIAARQMYSYTSAFYSKYPEMSEMYNKKALEYQHKLLEILPKNSIEYKYNLGEYIFKTGKPEVAKMILEEVVAIEPPESNIRARAAHHLSMISRRLGNQDDVVYYLALSAIADIKSATREMVSLQELGTVIYEQGKISKAYRYLSIALEYAVACGAPLRMIDTSKSLPIIENAHTKDLEKWQRTMNWIIASMALLIVGLVVLMFILRYEIIQMRKLQAHLRAANTAKEVYISRFLQLCSIYMDKLSKFSKIVTRKLAAGQADELYRMTKSGKFIEEQSREFYDVFDNAFLNIYPDFVSQVNELLRPDCRIELQPGELLNTDLRILAFMRLGIEESGRIAQILNYSLNTIYSYRNRLKGRAIDKDNFERDVMRIESL